MPKRTRSVFIAFVVIEKEAAKEEKEIVEKFDHCPVIVIGHLTLFFFLSVFILLGI